MARQIIILEDLNPGRSGGDPIKYRYAFWLSVPAARQAFYANATATSHVKDVTSGELTAIQNGSISEQVGSFEVPSGTTVTQIKAGLVSAYNAAQTAINSAAANKWDRYGSFFDGTTWTDVITA